MITLLIIFLEQRNRRRVKDSQILGGSTQMIMSNFNTDIDNETDYIISSMKDSEINKELELREKQLQIEKENNPNYTEWSQYTF